MNNKNKKELNLLELNNLIKLGKKILKIIYVLIIILGAYALTILIKELNIVGFILTILAIISPLFIGIIIAWLFDPFVKFLKSKGIKRGFGATITYILILGMLILLISLIIPILSEQINDFAKMLPAVFDAMEGWLNNIFEKLSHIENFDSLAVKAEIFRSFSEYATSLPTTIPDMTVNVLKALFSGLGVFVLGLVIGFYLLISFNNFNDSFITLIPKKFVNDARDLFNEINVVLRKFVGGTVLLSTMIFVLSAIGFYIAGLKGALLFALFCGITNIIPFFGPYIGGIPAIIVAFSQDVKIGIAVTAIIVIVQFIEGNFLQPILMSKTMRLHPVTIIIGLLVFGYYWGIIGMIVATPLIAVCKALLMYIDERFGILNFERRG